MRNNIKEVLSEMTLEEKAGLCSGLDFWHTKAVERLGIPSIMMTDGPVGLRKQAGTADHLGLNKSVPSTCFPSGSAMACSWDRQLLKEVGKAIGEECQAEDVSIILGPAVNIKRSPLCGRNFEYYSEDPVLASELGIGFVTGVQSQGVGTSLKHYAANNQETNRLTVDEKIDERTLREIYLASFENVIKKAQPWTVMCAYNKVNGTFCSEKPYLLTDVLKKEWGHEGIVMSDWGAVDDRVAGLAAGLELEMPGSQGINDRRIAEAVRSGKLPENKLDEAVERLLAIIFKAAENSKSAATFDREAHHRLASAVESDCIVLLKNENQILPLAKKGTYAVIGGFAVSPRYQGGGSSHINPTILSQPLEELKKTAPDAEFRFATGYALDTDSGMFSGKAFASVCDLPDSALIAKAQKTAIEADAAIIFAGLPENYESEGFDRMHMRIPEGQIRLIEAVCAVQKHVILVLQNGSAIEMPWIANADGVLEAYLGGQAVGSAVADVIFGNVNPSGKLAETFPVQASDSPCYLNFPGDGRTVEYREGIYVGYRYYEAKALLPLFPFGYGLSYTTFDYESITVNKTSAQEDESVVVKVKIRNSGKIAGKETVELYIHDRESSVLRPIKELKEFSKVLLQPGEVKEITFELKKRDFSFYDINIHDWVVESGFFDILVGPSSAETPLKASVFIQSARQGKKVYHRNTIMNEIMHDTRAVKITKRYYPDIFNLPISLLGSMPIRSIGMFGDNKWIDTLIDELNRQ